jgi:hypothetical protein
MKNWYMATCIVRLGEVQSINDGDGVNGPVKGYAINFGISGVDLMHAMNQAERIALSIFPGSRAGNRLEEVNIKETPVETLREQFQIESLDVTGETIYRSKLIYFDE